MERKRQLEIKKKIVSPFTSQLQSVLIFIYESDIIQCFKFKLKFFTQMLYKVLRTEIFVRKKEKGLYTALLHS